MTDQAPPGCIHYSELKPFPARGPLAEEWDTYRSAVGRLIGEGHEGQFVLIHGNNILGLYSSLEDALAEGYRRFQLGKDLFFVKQILTYERLLRGRVA